VTLLQWIGGFTPFIAAFVLRVASALLGLWVSLELCARILPSIRRRSYREMAFFGTLFLWAVPFLEARYSSESWGGALTFGGLCLLLGADAAWRSFESPPDEPASSHRGPSPGTRALALAACAGLVWGLAFFCRVQMAAAIGGAGLWWVAHRRGSWRLVGAALAMFVVACAANVVIDHWLYGAWVFTPFRYFDVNVLQGRSSTFGTTPWWMTVAPFLLMLLPPFSVAVVGVLAVGFWTCRRHVLVWMTVPFVLAHAALPHKELRFMAPLIFGLAPLVALSFDNLPARLAAWIDAPRLAALRAGVSWAFVVSNAAAMVWVTFVPALSTYPLIRLVWDESRQHPVRLFAFSQSLYVNSTSRPDRMRFYEPEDLSETLVHDARDIAAVKTVPPGTRVLVFYGGVDPPAALAAAGLRCAPRAATLSRSLRRLYGFRWITENHVWALCEPSSSP
jgi:GPI mannosyltransferase 3